MWGRLMAGTVSDGSESAAKLRSALRGLSRLLLRDVKGIQKLIVPTRLQPTVPTWIEAMNALVDQYGRTAASLAADFYDAERVAAGVRGTFTVPLPDAPPADQVSASLRWATKDLWPRNPDDPKTTVAQKQPLEIRLDQAAKKAEAAAQKLVADQNRATVRQAVQQDRQAVAYARAAALGACSFCRLMASRGATYKTAESAGRDADSLFSGDASVVKFHDNCHCALVPVYRGQKFELSPHAAEWARLYQEYAAPYSGDQLRRFRQAIAAHG